MIEIKIKAREIEGGYGVSSDINIHGHEEVITEMRAMFEVLYKSDRELFVTAMDAFVDDQMEERK